jgi:hypothetical protein
MTAGREEEVSSAVISTTHVTFSCGLSITDSGYTLNVYFRVQCDEPSSSIIK